MKILVDTHCWLWLQASPERLAERTLEHLANPDNEIFLSAASAWEIAIKHAMGKLPLPRAPGLYVPSRMARTNTSALPVTVQHALRVAKLPALHRDPFDRVLVAQAQVEKMVLLSADPLVLAYDVKTMSALLRLASRQTASREVSSSPAIGADGTLYIGRGYLYAYGR